MDDQFVLDIEKLLWRGRGLARLDSGQVVIVEPGVLPGEKVRAQIQAHKKDYLQAQAVEILSPSPLRVNHPCAHANQCGGSPFGMVTSQTGLALKKEILIDALTRSLGYDSANKLLSSLMVLPSPKEWRYRWRGQIHVQDHKAHAMAQGSSKLVALQDCLLLAEPLAQAMSALAYDLPDGRHTIAASPDTGQVAHEYDPQCLSFSFSAFDLTIHLPAPVFFQANWDLNQTLVQLVASLVDPFDRVADLFSGAGNFALPLSRLGKNILAVEGSPVALKAGTDNVLRLGLDKVRFQQANLSKDSSWSMVRDFAPQSIILDPPRTGAKDIGHHVTAIDSAQRLVWVSCDVINTLRDMQPLLAQGWEIGSMILLDMFPGTWHMEIVLVLDRC